MTIIRGSWLHLAWPQRAHALRLPAPALSSRMLALGVGLAGAAATVPGALRFSFWQDEVASARVIEQATAGAALTRIEQTESTPPAWYLVAWVAHRLGLSIEEARLISAISTAGTAALTVLLVRRVLPLWAAGLAGLLVAFGWQFVFHGRELRAYALLGLCSVAFALALDRAVDRATPLRLVALGLCVGVGCTTHYFFLFTLAGGLTWLLVEPRARGGRRSITAASVAGLVPLALWVPGFVHQYRDARYAWIGPFDGRSVVESLWLTFARTFPPGPVPREAFSALVLGGVTVGSARLWHAGSRGRLIACLAVLPVMLAALVWLAGPRIFVARNVIVAGPFAAVALAAAVTVLPRIAAAAVTAAVTVALIVGVAWSESAAPVAFDRVGAAVVAEGWRRSDPIVFAAGWRVRPPLAWYLPGHPEFAAVRPRDRTCDAVYVVVAPGAAWASVKRSALTDEVRATPGPYLVARLGPATPRQVLALAPGATLVKAKGSNPPCVGEPVR